MFLYKININSSLLLVNMTGGIRKHRNADVAIIEPAATATTGSSTAAGPTRN
jgi:hypothetical protein